MGTWLCIACAIVVLALPAVHSWSLGDSKGAPNSFSIPFAAIALLFLIAMASIVLSTAFHELGHAVCGWLTGFRLIGLGLGPWMLVRSIDHTWVIRRDSIVETLGLCAMATANPRRLRGRTLFLYLGGPLADCLLAGAALLCQPSLGAVTQGFAMWDQTALPQAAIRRPDADVDSQFAHGQRGLVFEAFLLGFTVVSLLFVAFTAIPGRTPRGLASDALAIWHILRNGKDWEQQRDTTWLLGSLYLDVPPEQWSLEMIERRLAAHAGEPPEAMFRLFAYWHERARGNDAAAELQRARVHVLRDALGAAAPLYDAEVLVDLAVRAALFNDDERTSIVAEADDRIANMQKAFGKADLELPRIARIAMTAALGDVDAALHQLTTVRGRRTTYAFPHDILIERLAAGLSRPSANGFQPLR